MQSQSRLLVLRTTCKIQLDFQIPDFTLTRQVCLKSRINWDGVYIAFDNIGEMFINVPCPVDDQNLLLLDINKTLKSRSHD